MLRRQLCSSSLCLFFLLFRLQRVSSTSSPPNPNYVHCSQNRHCAFRTDINVTYPFRLFSSPSYCGYPGFELNCKSDSLLTIKLGKEDYTVQNIDYGKNLIEVVDSQFMTTECPSSFTNTSINSTPFNYASADRNLTVYLNCNFQTTPPDLQEIPCLSNIDGLKNSYYGFSDGPSTFLENLNGRCERTAAVAVYYGQDFYKALQGGFGLTWSSSMDWCQQDCMSSGGLCGYNDTQPEDHFCYCSDANRLDSCGNHKHIDPHLLFFSSYDRLIF